MFYNVQQMKYFRIQKLKLLQKDNQKHFRAVFSQLLPIAAPWNKILDYRKASNDQSISRYGQTNLNVRRMRQFRKDTQWSSWQELNPDLFTYLPSGV